MHILDLQMNAWERDSCIPEEDADAEAERSKRPASADILRATKRLSCAEKRASNAPDADACGSSPPVKHSSTEYTVRAVQHSNSSEKHNTADFGVENLWTWNLSVHERLWTLNGSR